MGSDPELHTVQEEKDEDEFVLGKYSGSGIIYSVGRVLLCPFFGLDHSYKVHILMPVLRLRNQRQREVYNLLKATSSGGSVTLRSLELLPCRAN